VHSKPDPFSTQAWASAERAIRLYSWLTLAAVVYGILAAHVPFLIGHPWTTCKPFQDSLGCVLTFHFWEVPIILYLTWFACYGLIRLRSHVSGYSALFGLTLTALSVFALFEVSLILEGLRRAAPDWELAALFSITTILISGVGVGAYVRLKLTGALAPQP